MNVTPIGLGMQQIVYLVVSIDEAWTEISSALQSSIPFREPIKQRLAYFKLAVTTSVPSLA